MKHSIYRILLILLVICTATSKGLHAEEYSLRFYDDSDGLSHWHLTHTIQDSTGIMWVATWNGLNRFDGSRFVTFKPELGDGVPIHGDRIRSMRLTEDNNLLCLIDDRIFLFDTRTCTFDTLPTNIEKAAREVMRQPFNPDYARPKEKISRYGNLELRNIWSEYKDRQNNLWLINDHGLYVATPIVSHGQRINREEVRSMHRMRNGDIWAAVRNTEQLMVYDSTLHLRGYMDSLGRIHPRPANFGNMVYSVCETNDGRILVGCKPGSLLEYKTLDGNRYERVRSYPEPRNIYDIKQGNDGRLWIATYGFGLWVGDSRKSKVESQKLFTTVPGTEKKFIRRLLITDDGSVLAATTSGLMVLSDKGIRWHQREANNPYSLSSNAVMCLSMHQGKLYVGTEGGGVNKMNAADLHADKVQWENLTMREGLETDVVYEMAPWSDDELLLQGNTVLTIVNVAENKSKGSHKICNYGKTFFGNSTDGKLILGEVPPITLPDGRVLIAPASGILVLDKSELKHQDESIRIALDMVRRGDKKPEYAVDDLQQISLEPDERELILMYSALDYRNTGTVLYSTRFFKRGEENHPWDEPTKTNGIVLPNLHPGEYVFEVRSTNVYGHWQDNTRRLCITVVPTFWESTAGWVLQIGLLLLIAIAITIQSTRVHYHRKQRLDMLEAYLDLQERYLLISDQRSAVGEQQSVISDQQSAVSEQQSANGEQIHPTTQAGGVPAQSAEGVQPAPLPVPEILAPGYTSENEKFLNTLHVFMEQHIGDNNMSIDDIAKVTCMSRSSLNRKMHELFNLTAKDFVQAARIKHACNLLRTTDMATKEVAYACGFSDPRYFSKSFKANTGKTPTEYKEGHPSGSPLEGERS